jgi:hypothetical protein
MVSVTPRLPLTLSALPRVFTQPRVSAPPLASAQPTVSAEPFVSAQPTVSAVPCDSEVVVTLDPPWLSVWPAPPLTPALTASAAPELTVSDALALRASPLECETLSAAPVVCELPVDELSAWLVPSASASPLDQPCA